MTTKNFEIPIVFIIFNRPDTTKKVFEEIKKIRPNKLFVIADGPRPYREGEDEKCRLTREIINEVDWECTVYKNFSDINLGCKKRIYTGLNWVFEQVEEAIILEDDCLPDPSFFEYCKRMLELYRDNEKIMSIEGTNLAKTWKDSDSSYHFSKYCALWGWATWRRAWEKIDINMSSWVRDDSKRLILNRLGKEQFEIYQNIFNKAFNGDIDSWGYPWIYSVLVNNGLTVVPSKNLISNIGFGEGATHTKDVVPTLANLPRYKLNFPLKEREIIECDEEYDQIYFNSHNPSVGVFRKILPNRLKNLLKKLIKK